MTNTTSTIEELDLDLVKLSFKCALHVVNDNKAMNIKSDE